MNNIYGNERHKIIQGDSLEELKKIEDESIDLIFADPPYNIGKNFNVHKDKWETDELYLKWCYEWLDLCVKKIKTKRKFLFDDFNGIYAIFGHILERQTNNPFLHCLVLG